MSSRQRLKHGLHGSPRSGDALADEPVSPCPGSRIRPGLHLGVHRTGQHGRGRPLIAKLFEAFEVLAANPAIGHKREDLTAPPVLLWPVGSYLTCIAGSWIGSRSWP